jgi:hypothetical protein
VNIWGPRRHIVRLYPRLGEHLAMDHPHRPSHIHLCDASRTSFAQAGDHGGLGSSRLPVDGIADIGSKRMQVDVWLTC